MLNFVTCEHSLSLMDTKLSLKSVSTLTGKGLFTRKAVNKHRASATSAILW